MQRGEMIAEQLAPLVAPAMGHGDSDLLERIATQSLEQPDVRAVTFLAPDRIPLAHAGPTMLNQAPSGDSALLQRRSGNDATRYLLPVSRQAPQPCRRTDSRKKPSACWAG
jgi:two-component system sensor histidine kinase BarA